MRTVLRALLAAALPALAACASAPAAPPPRDEYYEGTSTVLLPGGRTVPGGAVLARRTLAPAAGTIVERVVSASGRPGRPATEYVVEQRVAGARFTMAERGGAFTGEGTFDGAPWRWPVWRSVSRLPDGTRVESTDSLTAEGLVAHKRVLDAAGRVVVTTTERLARVGAERFAARRAELLGGR